MSEPTDAGVATPAGAAAGKEENLLILKMLQEGKITADDAAELLQAVNARHAAPPVPPTPPTPPVPPPPAEHMEGGPESEAFAKARARIAAARETVAGVQERLAAAEEQIASAPASANPWEQVADALKGVPGARAIGDALRDIDPGRIAANARRQARKVARSVRTSLDDINIDFAANWAESLQGEPALTAPREATAAIPPGGVLRVRNTLGDIEVIGSDVPEARAAGVLKIWAADKAAAEALAPDIKLVVDEAAEGPTIRVEHPGKLKRVALDLKVFVPENGTRVTLVSPAGDVTARNLKSSGVVLATQSGDARAADVSGDVAAETASGDVLVERVTGNVAASSASGDVKVLAVTGQNLRATTQSGDVSVKDSTLSVVTVETVSGDAEVSGVTGKSLKARAVSGDAAAEDVSFETEVSLDTVSGYVSFAPKGPVSGGSFRLVTLSGDAGLKLPREANATLDVSTKGGDLRGKVLADDGKSEKTLSATGMVSVTETVGTGTGAKFTLSTVSGDVTVEQDTPHIELG